MRIYTNQPLSLPHTLIQKHSFSDGETDIMVSEDLTFNPTQDAALVYFVQKPINEYITNLLQTITFLQKYHQQITVCLPYLPYMRSKSQFLLHTLSRIGVTRCITIDAHADCSLSTLTLKNISVAEIFAKHIKENHILNKIAIVAPDKGAIKRCEAIRALLEISSPIIYIDKVRMASIPHIEAIHGDVKDKSCILIDDIIDTGKTLCNAAVALIKEGATNTFAYCTHGVLSKDAIDRVQLAPIKKLIITDTIHQAEKIETLSISTLITSALISN
ncbi:MAG: ribose-phosphate diphosphokinase [Candidatus Paracaedibacteraceae bacterium]|nr:ribose-phosphate diphosphokinase [Candidatus Paracaedibacteraceae bacterium]